MSKASQCCPYAPACPQQGWSGKRMTALEQIEQKTFQNKYGQDWYATAPYITLESMRDPMTNLYPLGGYCVPMPVQRLVGLNQSQIVAGESTMVLYTTYTRCPGTFDKRYMNMQM